MHSTIDQTLGRNPSLLQTPHLLYILRIHINKKLNSSSYSIWSSSLEASWSLRRIFIKSWLSFNITGLWAIWRWRQNISFSMSGSSVWWYSFTPSPDWGLDCFQTKLHIIQPSCRLKSAPKCKHLVAWETPSYLVWVEPCW